jgi:hypothetical protein
MKILILSAIFIFLICLHKKGVCPFKRSRYMNLTKNLNLLNPIETILILGKIN